MEIFLIKAAQLLLSLSLLVVVHEFGHFIFARFFKIRVEKFYLFFNPWFTLFKYKPKNSDTEYGIGWLPLGGYVKIAGMVDESMDKEQMAQPPQPWEFRTKPAWQRLFVIAAGVIFNFILAMVIFSMMLFHWGDTYISLKDTKAGMEFAQVAKDAGFKDRDVLISADGNELKMRDGVLSLNAVVSFMNANEVAIERDGKEMTITLDDQFGDRMLASGHRPFNFWRSTVVDSVKADSEAQRIGLQKGDSIVSFDGVALTSFAGLYDRVSQKSIELAEANGGTFPMEITIARDTLLITDTVMIDTAGVIGIFVQAQPPAIVKQEYGFFASFPAGISMGINMLKAYVGQMKYIFSKEGAKSVGGFGAIGGMFPAQWNWFAFWTMTAFLSLALAFLNILPIPLLDGGHIMFILYEMITGRLPNEKFQEYAQTLGMILLFGLLIYANGNDIIRHFFN